MLAKSKKALGMEMLAIMYSLPYALLMWGWVPNRVCSQRPLLIALAVWQHS